MNFVSLLRSLEELLYEVMTWLVFYPRTLWRSMRRPVTMLRYSNREQRDAAEQQYTDTLSPPLFLMLTILISHVLEVASHQALPHANNAIGRQIVESEQNFLLLRFVLFSIYPLMFAVRRLHYQRTKLDRETLRAPFFAQCYVASPAALALGIAAILGRAQALSLQIAGLALSLGSIGWYLWVEAKWLHLQARLTRFRAARSAIGTWLLATFINAIIGFVIIGAAV